MSIKGFQIGEGSVQKYDYTELDNKPTVPVVDATLATTGAAADAKKTGDEIADLKSAISVMKPSATASDVGKALKVKTVEDGEVTEYEFGESVTIDDTLTEEGQAADSKAVGDTILALSTDLAELTEVVDTLNEGGLDIKDDVIIDQITGWLDDHPEATTTVEDGAITFPKLNSVLSDAVVIRDITEEGYYHNVAPTKVTVYPNEYTQNIPIRYVGNENLFDYDYTTGTQKDVTKTKDGRFLKLSGTSSGGLTLYSTANATVLSKLAGKTVNLCIYFKKANAWGNSSYFMVRVNDSSNVLRVNFSSSGTELIGWTLSENIEIPAELTKFEIRFNTLSGSSFASGDYFWFGIFESSPVITEKIITTDPTEISVSGLTKIDTMMHESVAEHIVPSKTYIDEHTPDIIGYWSDNVYAMPEKFGAKGDGIADDATALTNCIAYAVSNGKAVRGYGKYKTSSTIVLNGQYLDVYFREINYTGNGYAVEIQHMDIRLEFHRIVSSGAGINFTHNNDTTAKYARRCRIIGNEITSDGNCITAQRKTLYNTCEIRVLSSLDGNCIEYSRDGSADDFVAGEYVYRSSSCSCPNGYAVKKAVDSKFYDFTVESNCKYGLLDPLGVACYGWRHREQIDAMSRKINGDTGLTNGALITFTQSPTNSKYGFIYNTVDGLFPWSIDVSAIQGYDAILSTDDWNKSAYNGIYMNVPITVSGQINGVLQPYAVIADKVCFIGNNKVFIPAGRKTVIINKAEYDYTLFEAQDTESILEAVTLDWGTDFLLDVSHADIYLNASFGAIGYNDLTLTQADGNTAKIYDKLGNVLFDGTNEGDGKWRFRCVMDRSSNGRRGGSAAWWCYDGTNEFWEIEKLS